VKNQFTTIWVDRIITNGTGGNFGLKDISCMGFISEENSKTLLFYRLKKKHIIARIQEKSLDFSQSFISSLPIIERHWAKEKKRRGDVKP